MALREPASEPVALNEPAPVPVAHRHRAPRRGGFLRGLSGVLAGGLVALVVALVVAWVVALRVGSPGPGAAVLAVHAVAAAVAVAIQFYADRTPGPRGSLAALSVLVLVAAVLAYEWLI
jgi:hypothetical protein